MRAAIKRDVPPEEAHVEQNLRDPYRSQERKRVPLLVMAALPGRPLG